jgi:hypothetical protein
MRRGDIVRYGTSKSLNKQAMGAVGIAEEMVGRCGGPRHGKSCNKWKITWLSIPGTLTRMQPYWHSCCLRKIGHAKLPRLRRPKTIEVVIPFWRRRICLSRCIHSWVR